ncbi:hypothetical protein BH10ACI3_BH10ACI3_10020 [soil metagenome]
MPEPISTALSFCIGFAALNGYRRNDSALSSEAKSAVAEMTKVIKAAEESQALFGAKSNALSDLRNLAEEHADDNWDGENSIGIDSFALWNAEDFIRSLPHDFPLPEFAPEPDGSISLDWIRSRHSMFSLSIGGNNRIAYAWLEGTDKGHGVAHFDGTTIPSRILAEIQPFLNNGKSALRTA